MHAALAPGVEMVLLARHLKVVRSADRVDLSPGKSMRLPLAVHRTL